MRCHWQQNDTGGCDTDADANKIGRTGAESLRKWQPKHSRDGSDQTVNNLNNESESQENEGKESYRRVPHLANNQIPVGYAYMSPVDEADVVQTHHAVLQNEAGSCKFEELSVYTE